MDSWGQKPEDDFHTPTTGTTVYHFTVRPDAGLYRIGSKTSVPLPRWRWPTARECVRCIKESLPNYHVRIEVYDADGLLFKTVVREP